MFSLFTREERKETWLLEPITYAQGANENFSGKMTLPQSCLMDLVERQAETPYIFRVSAHGGVSYTHCGVLDFTAEPGVVAIARWMHDQLSWKDLCPWRWTTPPHQRESS
jgi:hypothetical protein